MFDQKVYLFLSVVETGSFSGAAKVHYISQSAVSQSINKLESELNIQLFDRSHYRPQLTEAGKYYYDALSKFIMDYGTVVKNARNISLNKNRIVIGITNDFEKKHLSKIVREFKKENDVNIAVKRCSPFESVSSLQNRIINISIGMNYDLDNIDGIINTPIYHNHICIICSENNPLANRESVTSKELVDQPVVILNQTLNRKTYTSFMNAFKLDGFLPNIVKECDDIDDFMMSVSLNEGIGYTVEELVDDEDGIVSVPLIESHRQSVISAAYNQEETNIFVIKIIKMIKSYFESLEEDYK